MTIRFVDSNIFVYVMMGDPAFSAKSLQILTGFEEGKEQGWTSTLALSQVFSHLKKRKKYQAIDKFYDFLEGSPIRVTETTRDDIVNARTKKEEQGLSWSVWDDLVISAQMHRLGISEIYSNDADFDKLKGLTRLF
ncbi:MAG: type II toxin-antitoxin system VapC family toxin [Nitrososphaerota archaeon]|nr:type II toxin-antitoxin system VapC family toxin [Nitrososphaerota archaeon]